MVSFFVKLVCEVVENRCDYDDGRKLLVQAAALQAPRIARTSADSLSEPNRT